MPGHFYPLPPPFIGGRQPYAPELGNPQSGPTPEAPPRRSNAQFATIESAWRAAVPYVQRRLLVPQDAPAVTGPPPVSSKTLGIVISWWARDVVTSISLASVAPFLSADQPPPRTTLFLSILDAWKPPPYSIPRPVGIASILPRVDDPPRRSYAAQIAGREAWNFPPPPSQGYTEIAPLVPAAAVADAPPATSLALLYRVRESWNPAPYPLPEGANVAPVLPVVVPDAPPLLSRAALYAIRDSWNPLAYALPEGAQIAPLVPIEVADGPPRTSWANFGTIRASWEIAPDRVPRVAGRLAPFIPAPAAPDNPPKTSHVRMFSILRQHDVAQWWPLPQFIQVEVVTASGPTTVVMPPRGGALFTAKPGNTEFMPRPGKKGFKG